MRAMVDDRPAEPGMAAEGSPLSGSFTSGRFDPGSGPVLHVQSWAGGDPGGRPLLMTHGTGYCGATL